MEAHLAYEVKADTELKTTALTATSEALAKLGKAGSALSLWGWQDVLPSCWDPT